MVDKYIIVSAILAITILEIFALSTGHDGTILALSLSMISGLAGWSAPQPKQLIKRLSKH